MRMTVPLSVGMARTPLTLCLTWHTSWRYVWLWIFVYVWNSCRLCYMRHAMWTQA